MNKVVIDVEIKGDMNDIWSKWSEASHIKNWYFASLDWHVPYVEQSFEVGKTFLYRMEAKDGSMGFDFTGRFKEIDVNKSIIYVLEDNRQVVTTFSVNDCNILLVQEFEVEDELSSEMQKQGWQAILNQFKSYVEK
jgi:uncharacterized protein YndB with AHSA1/START domain